MKNEPDTERQKPKSRRGYLALGGVGVLVLGGLLYGLFMAMPNTETATDFSRFQAADFKGLEVMRDAPPQPVEAFTNVEDKPVTLSDFHGKVTVVNLWATWCAPCVTEMPTLAALQRAYSADDLVVVAISVDRDDTKAEAITQLKQLSGGALAFYHDPKMRVVFPMKAQGFPTTVVYDRNGKELARYAGEADWAGPSARRLIEAAIAGN